MKLLNAEGCNWGEGVASCHLLVPGEIRNNNYAIFFWRGEGWGLKKFTMVSVQVENYTDQAEFFYQIMLYGEFFTTHASRKK